MRAIGRLESDLAAGIYDELACDLASAFVTGRELSRTHSSTTGARSLDVLHVAIAIECGIAEFVTGDGRQGDADGQP